MVPSRETAMTGKPDAQGLIAFAKTAEEADDELDQYLRAYCGQPLDVMRHVQAIRGGSVEECLDWLARYVDAGARHLILRIGSLTARPESVAEQLLPALKENGSP
jgi:alkanesulfonate monooxygenase SsuD/methylene tetrahydromethanopterin reductase-like flavin-dependent oxidoreductase (luciferase family)